MAKRSGYVAWATESTRECQRICLDGLWDPVPTETFTNSVQQDYCEYCSLEHVAANINSETGPPVNSRSMVPLSYVVQMASSQTILSSNARIDRGTGTANVLFAWEISENHTQSLPKAFDLLVTPQLYSASIPSYSPSNPSWNIPTYHHPSSLPHPSSASAPAIASSSSGY